MTQRKDTTVAINEERNERLKDAAIEITIQNREQIRPSEIVHYLIDNMLESAIEELKKAK
jgi:hypothetical protein